MQAGRMMETNCINMLSVGRTFMLYKAYTLIV